MSRMPEVNQPFTTLVGWREWVGLPDVGVEWIKAKVDTGAKTSSLHVFEPAEESHHGEPWVCFSIHPWQDSASDAVTHRCPILDRRPVRSSSGHTEERIVVRLAVRLAGRTIDAEVTLTNRDEMGFRMLIGREALVQGYRVDPAGSYLGGRPHRSTRRRNRGR
ncbi:MAG: ATP-dependent zinc protease [Desertimonas sp.]